MKNLTTLITALLILAAFAIQADACQCGTSTTCGTTTTMPGNCGRHSMTIVSDPQTLADDSASVATWVYPGWPKIDGATWIWNSYLLDSETKFGPVTFTREFLLPSDAVNINGQIVITADNAYELYLNQNDIGSDGTVSNPPIDHTQDPEHVHRWNTTETYDVTPEPGANRIMINAVNYRGWVNASTNPAGIIYRLDISYVLCGTTTTTTATTTTTCHATTTSTPTTTTIPCRNLWWFDNEHRECTNSTFCGAYMYLGLRTFDSKEECENNLTTTTTCPATTTTCPATTTSTSATTTTTIPCINGVSIRARGQSAAGVAPTMQLWIDGKLKAQWNVIDSIRDYLYETSLGTAGHNIDVVYTNNCETATTDRNLFVYQLQAGCTVIQSTDSGVKYDKGVGNAAFDGLDVVPGQAEMYWSGALRFKTNGGSNQTTTTSTTQPTTTSTTASTTTTLMQCSIAGDNPPCGQVTLGEVMDMIQNWSNDKATIGQVLDLIIAYKNTP